ncbi:low molecular weight protein-tyrosine-phosphatase [Cupriavidus agavae]|uniref:protein-tyrosine-phosphatase n=1 Tax=Cupriavidus agavae TaxID=1001822 RepID=A0A4Q7RGT7_9BURK|nr:low molecular weight protein-tyrosine-phosphatase [Cupriavidus agavae]RZT31847.1 protein-tyrosine phosphatase [Cupriavidus agavae]
MTALVTPIRSILVVCLGNRCRSPMAALLLQQALPGCHVLSAGLEPPVGAGADPRAVRLLAQEGVDLRPHRARAIDAPLVDQADLVLVMEDDQRLMLEGLHPGARGKTFRLCESIDADVPDPYGGSHGMFAVVLGMIRHGVEAWTTCVRERQNASGCEETS